LNSARLNESYLQGIQWFTSPPTARLSATHPFDGGYPMTLRPNSGQDTAIDRAPIQQNSTGSALACFTAMLNTPDTLIT
jgi:hypothetical protein